MRLRGGQDPVWEGADILRPFLVPIGDLEPFDGNPRRGDVPAIVASLQRFGQVKAIVVDGTRIIAGHHLVLAATDLGWTHVAAMSNQFSDEDEQRAFLLADNRTSELGGNDDALLAQHLAALLETDSLTGTGYTSSDYDDMLAALAAQADTPEGDDTVEVTFRAKKNTDETELVLIFNKAQRREIEGWLEIVGKETGAAGPSEQVHQALKIAALKLNAG